MVMNRRDATKSSELLVGCVKRSADAPRRTRDGSGAFPPNSNGWRPSNHATRTLSSLLSPIPSLSSSVSPCLRGYDLVTSVSVSPCLRGEIQRRPSFTLVEMLMVIFIISIVAALVGIAATGVMSRARETQTLVEISQLDMALERYKAERGAYPPNPGTRDSDTSPTPIPDMKPIPLPKSYWENRDQKDLRIERHLFKAFPRYQCPQGYRDPTSPTAALDSFREHVEWGTRRYDRTNSSFVTPGLDIDRLDAAEALVFWLGGIADRVVTDDGIAFQMLGFRATPQNPICDVGWEGYEQRDTTSSDPKIKDRPQIQWIPPLYEFDTTRLVDSDQDGWPEYVPQGSSPTTMGALPAGMMPPYVYFDAPTYRMLTSYPIQPSDSVGAAAPYVQKMDTPDAGPNDNIDNNGVVVDWGKVRMTFANANKFQIIAAGTDGAYSSPVFLRPSPPDPPPPPPRQTGISNVWRFFEIPSTHWTHNMSDADNDNLSNFSTRKLGDEVKTPGG